MKELRLDFGARAFSTASVAPKRSLPTRFKLRLSPAPLFDPRQLNPSCVMFCVILKQNISHACQFQGGVTEFGRSRDTFVGFHAIHRRQKPTGAASTTSLAHVPNVMLTRGTGKGLHIYIYGVKSLTILQPVRCDQFPSSSMGVMMRENLLQTMRSSLSSGCVFSYLFPTYCALLISPPAAADR